MLFDWIIIISLLLFGVILLITELIFIPGTTIIGIFGALMTIAGIWVGYATFGAPTGHLILGGAVALNALAIAFSFRPEVWARFGLKEQNKGKALQDAGLEFVVGEEGYTLSALRPSGTASFHEKPIEVHTRGEFINTGTAVRILKIEGPKILVEQLY